MKNYNLIGNLISRSDQKKIVGGFRDNQNTSCSVTCSNGHVESKDCGDGVSCASSEGKIYCGGKEEYSYPENNKSS